MREASGLASGTASYDYWADGARRQKTYASVTSVFYYTGDQEIAEYTSSTLTRRFIRLPGSVDEPFLMIDNTLDAACTNASYATCEVWAHQNRLGSVVATTDSAGVVVEKYTYSSYGVSDDATGFPFRFTGQKLDAETGLYYYKARYYDPETGRFLQTDPIGYKDQMNLYAYVGNDPMNLRDPSGLYNCTADADDCEIIDEAVDQAISDADEALNQINDLNNRLSEVGYDKTQLSEEDQNALIALEVFTGNEGDTEAAITDGFSSILETRDALIDFKDDDYLVADRANNCGSNASACARITGVTFTDLFFDVDPVSERASTTFHEGAHLAGQNEGEAQATTNSAYYVF